DGAPPLDRHLVAWRVEIKWEIRNAIEKIGSAFDRGAVHAIFDGVGLEGGAGGDGLADNGVRPSNGIAFRMEPGGKAIVPHRTVPAASEIVLACPDNFDRCFDNFRNVDGFDHEVPGRLPAT